MPSTRKDGSGDSCRLNASGFRDFLTVGQFRLTAASSATSMTLIRCDTMPSATPLLSRLLSGWHRGSKHFC